MKKILLALMPITAACAIDDGTSGAAPTPSASVSPRELRETLVATAAGDGSIDVLTMLETAPGRSIELRQPDALSARHRGRTIALTPRLFEPTTYMTYVGSLPEGDGPIATTLLFGGRELTSSVDMPAPFALSLANARIYSRTNDDIVLRWTPARAGDRMYYYVAPDCGALGEVDVADTGELTIPRGQLRGSGVCNVTVYVRRSRAGSASSAFGGGARVLGEQLRTVQITTRP
jgi:hypothetical protein